MGRRIRGTHAGGGGTGLPHGRNEFPLKNTHDNTVQRDALGVPRDPCRTPWGYLYSNLDLYLYLYLCLSVYIYVYVYMKTQNKQNKQKQKKINKYIYIYT